MSKRNWLSSIRLGYWPVAVCAIVLIAEIAIELYPEAVQNWYYYNTSVSGLDEIFVVLNLMVKLAVVQVLMVLLAWLGPGVKNRKLSIALCSSMIVTEIIFATVVYHFRGY